ncbi:hypothetical protein PR001_g29344 [Phytophthora rubi]|uniref:Uncharacterized protein n=1 Tax=Phytophthora rubi TaxID=129364 RepID=A0A6A3H1V1_9STRA|nr:hypothetical protein PR002_g29453 [Phytophthora rubi]KAE8963539.1 hypothetical protein PR001_g29344 [Phytophthora rubi]
MAYVADHERPHQLQKLQKLMPPGLPIMAWCLQ